MSKARAQGTSYEVQVRDWWRARGHTAERLAEGGSLDRGDVAVDFHGEEVVCEAKARQVLSVQETLSKALAKAGHSRVLVYWKRLTPQGGGRRKPVAGVREVVIMTPEMLDWLLAQVDHTK